MKGHIGEKLINCKQCNYAANHTGVLKTHLKMHSGVKSKKCNQCDYAAYQAGKLRRHLKTHSGEKLKNVATAIIPSPGQAI